MTVIAFQRGNNMSPGFTLGNGVVMATTADTIDLGVIHRARR